MKKILPLLLFLSSPYLFAQKSDNWFYQVHKAIKKPKIDGKSNDSCWKLLEWQSIDQKWMGGAYFSDDFSGRYKLTWSREMLYVLVEIVDDQFSDDHNDPLDLYWEDDCLEIFIDEDHSGGDHAYNYNAFAYHIAMDGNVVDIGPDKKPHLYNDHLIMAKTITGTTATWEIGVKVFTSSFKDNTPNAPLTLGRGKRMGLALAYCDNDSSNTRENFFGSVFIPGDDKNKCWMDASVFGTIELVE